MPLGAQLPSHHEPLYTPYPSRTLSINMAYWMREADEDLCILVTAGYDHTIRYTLSFPTATTALLMFA